MPIASIYVPSALAMTPSPPTPLPQGERGVVPLAWLRRMEPVLSPSPLKGEQRPL